ncbi:unnamed protein product, partial [marine sediment metagenome]
PPIKPETIIAEIVGLNTPRIIIGANNESSINMTRVAIIVMTKVSTKKMVREYFSMNLICFILS